MQIILFFIVVVLIIILFAIIKSNFSLKNKLVFFFILFSLILSAFVYEAKLSDKEDRNRVVINAFNQGKSIYCENNEVNSSYFLLNFGTLSFVPKEDKTEFKGVVYPVEKCSKIHK